MNCSRFLSCPVQIWYDFNSFDVGDSVPGRLWKPSE
jgi:hypothetical protein